MLGQKGPQTPMLAQDWRKIGAGPLLEATKGHKVQVQRSKAQAQHGCRMWWAAFDQVDANKAQAQAQAQAQVQGVRGPEQGCIPSSATCCVHAGPWKRSCPVLWTSSDPAGPQVRDPGQGSWTWSGPVTATVAKATVNDRVVMLIEARGRPRASPQGSDCGRSCLLLGCFAVTSRHEAVLGFRSNL